MTRCKEMRSFHKNKRNMDIQTYIWADVSKLYFVNM